MFQKKLFHPALLTAVWILAGCGDSGTEPRPPAELDPAVENEATGEAGEVVRVAVVARDERGEAMGRIGIGFSVASGGGSVEPQVVETGTDGRAETEWTLGPSTGQQILRASASGITTEITIEATAGIPVTMEKVGGDGQVGPPGATLQDPLQVRLLDQFDNPVPGRTVQFAASDGTVDPAADVTDSLGVAGTELTLSGASEEVTVTASATGTGVVEFTATVDAASLTILTARPRPGRLTVEYDERLVAIGGADEYSWEVTRGSLPPGIVLDGASGTVSGLPVTRGTYPVTLRAEDAAGASATRDISFLVCEEPISLNRGEPIFTDARGSGECGFFLRAGSAGTRYRVGIVRPTSSEDSNDVVTASLVVRGDESAVAATPPAAFASRLDRVYPRPVPPENVRRALEVGEHTARFHRQLRQDEQRLLQRLGADARLLSNAPSPAPSLMGGVALAPAPERRTFRPYAGPCSPAPARRVGVLVGQNDHLAVYQDSIQRENTPADEAHVERMLDYYRDSGRAIIDDYFGGVSDIDGSGNVVVFISPVVNANVAAFVWSGDFFATSGAGETCAASNEMELIYFNVSVVNAIGDGDYQALPTLVHEVKHVSSLYKRIRATLKGVGGGLHPVWLEEGTAEIASEMSSRAAWAAAGGPAVGAEVAGRDISATGTTPENYGVVLKLFRVMGYLSSQPNALTTNPTGAGTSHSFYGSGWHFHRFLGDAYGDGPRDEADIFRAQNDSLTVEGTSALPQLVGRSFGELLEEYTAAIMVEGTDASLPQLGFRTYDFATATDIFTAATSPPGLYPWPVTGGGSEGESAASLATATYQGLIGPAGIRIHDFVSNGTGAGAEIQVNIPEPARLVIVRVD